METWDEVDGVGNDESHDEGIAGACDDVRDLDVKLFPVVVRPATNNNASINAVQTDDVGCAKESVGKETEHTGDAMLGEHVHGIIDSKPVFDCRTRSANSISYLGGLLWGCAVPLVA